MSDITPSAEAGKWKRVTVTFLGFFWAADFVISAAIGSFSPGAALALLGFASPVLEVSSRRLWHRIAFWLCVLEVCISPMLWVGFMVSFVDPLSFRFRVLGVPLFTIQSPLAMFGYCVARAALFASAAYLVASAQRHERQAA